jgi:hypothetical protein
MGHVFGFGDGEEDVTTLIPISSWYGKNTPDECQKIKLSCTSMCIFPRG